MRIQQSAQKLISTEIRAQNLFLHIGWLELLNVETKLIISLLILLLDLQVGFLHRLVRG